MSETLSAAWHELMRRFLVAEADSAAALARLTSAYAEPWRSYHTLVHIDDMLDALGPAAPPLLVLAAWYHDAVYDPRASDNEARSAELARAELQRLGLPAPMVDRVAALILMTCRHEAPPADTEAALFLDADLAVLGASPAKYAAYADAIRAEYAWVPEKDYRRGRRTILAAFLTRPQLYQTPEFRERLEAAARANLQREISRLTREEN